MDNLCTLNENMAKGKFNIWTHYTKTDPNLCRYWEQNDNLKIFIKDGLILSLSKY